MRIFKSLILITSLFLSFNMVGQKRTYIGIEAAVTNDKFKLEDPNNMLMPTHCVSTMAGINVSQDLNYWLSIETGFSHKFYQKGIGLKGQPDAYSVDYVLDTWQVPLRFNARLNLKSNIIFLKPTIGFHYCFNNDFFSSSGSGFGFFNGEQTPIFSYDETTNTSLTKTFLLLETGLGLEIKLSGKSLLTFSGSYYTGFKDVMQSHIVYQVNGSPESGAVMTSKGNYFSYSVGFRFPVGGRRQ